MTDQLRPDRDPETETTSTETAVATSPVTPPPSATVRPKSRARWIAALGVVGLVIVGSVLAGLALTGSSPAATVTGYVPANSVMYGEVRLDLPGDQRAKIGEFLSKFPGFADQAALNTKLDEVLDRLLSDGTDGRQTFTRDIKPWFDGELAFAVGTLPNAAALDDPSAASAQARGLVLLSIKDEALARAWFADAMISAGATHTAETYAGTELTVFGDALGRNPQGAFALVGGKVAIAGDLASVKAAIDTKGSAGLPTVAQFRTAQAALPGDQLAFAYVDAAAILESSESLTGAAAEAMPSMPAFMGQLQVPWGAAAVRAEGGAFVVDTAIPHMTALGAAKNSESRLPALLPPTTVALVEGHDVGETLQKAKELFAGDPAMAEGIKQVEDALALVGGYGAIVDWMGEVGLAITVDGDSIGGGLVVTPLDAAAPERLFTQLRGFIALAGGFAGLTVTEESHAGATIVVIDLGDLGDLAGEATDGAIEAPANLKIAYTVTDDVVVLGYGTDFVKAVLDARTGDSLARSERFAAALKLVDKAHGSLVWLDLAAMRGLVESQIPADEKGAYQTEIKPYLDAFDSVIGVNIPGETIDRSTLILRVSGD